MDAVRGSFEEEGFSTKTTNSGQRGVVRTIFYPWFSDRIRQRQADLLSTSTDVLIRFHLPEGVMISYDLEMSEKKDFAALFFYPSETVFSVLVLLALFLRSPCGSLS